MRDYIFIAVNYNNSHESIEYIRSVLTLKDGGHRVKVVIVDNNSSTQEKEIMRAYIASERPYNSITFNFTKRIYK